MASKDTKRRDKIQSEVASKAFLDNYHRAFGHICEECGEPGELDDNKICAACTADETKDTL